MWVRHLTLSHFRNYRSQELTLPQGIVLLLGDNAQGKSNLLEAAYLLATTRSERAQTDGELIGWDVLDEPQPVARVSATVERRDGPVEIEVVVAARPPAGAGGRIAASKRLRVNGVPRRQADVVGQLTAVFFTTDDLALVSGAPSERRRYLDVTLSQLEPAYMRALQRYGKVLSQRNSLLRRVQAGEAQEEELAFWDGELSEHGAVLMAHRAAAADALAERARDAHRRLSGALEDLRVSYEPRLDVAQATSESDIAAALRGALVAGRPRDIGAGATLTGPHRDDLLLTLDGVAAASFASRGQQRTVALALRLAEARFMADRKGDLPVVLLDDVLSELDEDRRLAVLESLGEWEQILITSTDGDRFGEGLLTSAAAFRISAGTVEPLS